jgi:uncharacterized RDD family membrane protein YckC
VTYPYEPNSSQPAYRRPSYDASPPHPAPGALSDRAVADMSARFGARLLDGFILIGLVIPIGLVSRLVDVAISFGTFRSLGPPLSTLLSAMFIVVWFGYEPMMTAKFGATIGKRALKIAVVRADDGGIPGWGSALLRSLIPFLGLFFCYVGQTLVYLSPFFDSSGRRQGWHDRVASTLVVRTDQRGLMPAPWSVFPETYGGAAESAVPSGDVSPRVPTSSESPVSGAKTSPAPTTGPAGYDQTRITWTREWIALAAVMLLLLGVAGVAVSLTQRSPTPTANSSTTVPSTGWPPSPSLSTVASNAPGQVAAVGSEQSRSARDLYGLHVSSLVDSAAGGVDTGVAVRVGQSIKIRASGTTTYGYESAPCAGLPFVDAAGHRQLNGVACPVKYDGNMPVPTAPVGSLIGRVGSSSRWYEVGTNIVFTCSVAGELYLAYNDAKVDDDSGSYLVDITVT